MSDFTDSKAPTVSALPPRGLNVIAAARYWGVSPGTFRKLVKLGVAPAPMQIHGVNRNIYDREAIDRAMTALSDNPAIEVELEREIVL